MQSRPPDADAHRADTRARGPIHCCRASRACRHGCCAMSLLTGLWLAQTSVLQVIPNTAPRQAARLSLTHAPGPREPRDHHDDAARRAAPTATECSADTDTRTQRRTPRSGHGAARGAQRRPAGECARKRGAKSAAVNRAQLCAGTAHEPNRPAEPSCRRPLPPGIEGARRRAAARSRHCGLLLCCCASRCNHAHAMRGQSARPSGDGLRAQGDRAAWACVAPLRARRAPFSRSRSSP